MTASERTARAGKRRARKVGLTYVNEFDDGIKRRRCGRGFTYLTPGGRTLRSGRTRRRIDSLVIPPAWEDVWICPRANGHIQATGRDEAGRKQYIYHKKWQAISQATKFHRMHLVACRLPRIRRRVRRDLRPRRLTRSRVLAAVVRLLDRAHLRVGSERYVEERGTRGVTTLTSDHVDVDRFRIYLDFPGKSGRRRKVEFSDRKVAAVVRECEEIDGKFLFCYEDADGDESRIDSTDVNNYLREVSGTGLTAKDLRTWWGSVLALDALVDGDGIEEDARPWRDRKIVAAVKATAEALGNTPAVCRRSYIHPTILAAAASGELAQLLREHPIKDEPPRELTIAEGRFAALLSALES
jgi:DNA topoisomerase-1